MLRKLPPLNYPQENQNLPGPRQQAAGAAIIHNKSSIFSLPPVSSIEAPNSSIVRQRVSAKDCLAAATVTAGASLPLMIGGSTRYVLNLVEQGQQPVQQNQSNPPGPQNTALRAEQRRQNMSVSVVRPVMSLAGRQQTNTTSAADDFASSNINISKSSLNLNDLLWSNNFAHESGQAKSASILDDFIKLDFRASKSLERSQIPTTTGPNEDLLLFGVAANQQLDFGSAITGSSRRLADEFGEQNARQQVILFRREEFELDRGVRKEHKFLLSKIEERKRNLQIIQSIWAQKDFKTAIEKLVDIYQCGLVFTSEDIMSTSGPKQTDHGVVRSNCSEHTKTKRLSLSSLQTPLVVDVIGMIVLRPKLWNLEICQLVLPIIVNDLLGQSTKYENYIEVAIKSLKLILSCFSPVIKSTLEASGLAAPIVANQHRRATEAAAGSLGSTRTHHAHRGSLGVDLSQEDRVSKCLTCYKLLLEAHRLIAHRSSAQTARDWTGSRLLPMFRELNQALAGFVQSMAPVNRGALNTSGR